MRVVVAPDSYGGLLGAAEATAVVVARWTELRPGDEVVGVPLSDGGTGFADVLPGSHSEHETEVVGPLGLPVVARWWLDEDDTAVVESAAACGLHLVDNDDQDPRQTTTWGVGQLLDAARAAGARRILVGLGGSATVDGGAGALSGLGFRLTVADGSGLKIGGEDLHRVAGAARGWADDVWFADTAPDVLLLADVTATIEVAAERFGPQKGADPETVAHLRRGLAAWSFVATDDLGAADLAGQPGTGAAGGLAFGLAAGLPTARIVRGIDVVADAVGLDDALAGADLLITGEGRLDDASFDGKVVGAVARRAAREGVPTAAIVGEDRTSIDHDVRVVLLGGEHVSGDREVALRRLRDAVDGLVADLADGAP